MESIARIAIASIAIASMCMPHCTHAATTSMLQSQGRGASLTMPARAASPITPTTPFARRAVHAAMRRPGPRVAGGAAPEHALPAPPSSPAPPVHGPATILNVEGLAAGGMNRGDVNGAAGASQFVQIAGQRMAVYRKQDMALQLGPLPVNSIFAGSRGDAALQACRGDQHGAATVIYDQLAHRWVLAYLAGQVQCLAVSTGPDALGPYLRYASALPGAAADDPRLALWPDGYYLTTVLFDAVNGDYLGPRLCAIGRAGLLKGAATAMRCHQPGPAFGALTPASLDGYELPPADDAQAYLLSLDFTEDGRGQRLLLWRHDVDSGVLAGPEAIAVAPFQIACLNGPCIAQAPPGERLDGAAERLSGRVAYRRNAGGAALFAAHTTGHKQKTIRWYEIRLDAKTARVYQQGEAASDANDRWMAGIAADKMGNLALVYNVAGPLSAPGIGYAGRGRTGAPGRLDAEQTIVNGSGVQTDAAGRWGGHGGISIDPLDDCTFWTTLQYIASSGHHSWRTRIASFRFENCR